MQDRDRIQAYLQSFTYKQSISNALQRHDGPFPFITISRQAGAGGHSLSRIVLEAMQREPDRELFSGWTVFDASTCMEILNRARLRVPFENLVAEEYHSPLQEVLFELFGNESPQEQILLKIIATLKTLTSLGKVIVIGRGAACYTQKLPLGIHVRLVASLQTRVERVRSLFQVDADNARRIVEKRDTARSQFVSDLFNRKIDDPLLYHAIWNTERVSLQEIASFLVEAVRARESQSGACRHRLLVDDAIPSGRL